MTAHWTAGRAGVASFVVVRIKKYWRLHIIQVTEAQIRNPPCTFFSHMSTKLAAAAHDNTSYWRFKWIKNCLCCVRLAVYDWLQSPKMILQWTNKITEEAALWYAYLITWRRPVCNAQRERRIPPGGCYGVSVSKQTSCVSNHTLGEALHGRCSPFNRQLPFLLMTQTPLQNYNPPDICDRVSAACISLWRHSLAKFLPASACLVVKWNYYHHWSTVISPSIAE